MNMPSDTRKRWFMYGIVAIVTVVFGRDAATAVLNALAIMAPAV